MIESSSGPKIFFIVGCQRTGTTLMRLILESHSKISCVDESRSYSILQNTSLLNKELELNKNKTWLGFKVPRITEQMLEPFLADIGVKFRTPNNFKKVPLIFMIRNVFDTIVSMKTLDENEKSWLEMWAEKTVNFWVSTYPNFKNLYKHDLEILNDSKKKAIVAGAIFWKFKTISCLDYEKNNIPLIKIRYEDLVTNSKDTIKDVIEFLNLEWQDSLLFHEKMSHAETDEKGFTIGKTNTKSPIFDSSVNRYSKHLSSDEISEISSIAKDLMLKLNYSP